MNNTALAGIIVGAVVVTAVGAMAANSGFNPLQKYATVVVGGAGIRNEPDAA